MAEYQGPVILSLNAPNIITIGLIVFAWIAIGGLVSQLVMRRTGRGASNSLGASAAAS